MTLSRADVPDRCDHIVVAPHFDDAALSCGGMIARATSQRQRVLVLNVCTGALPSGARLSAYAQGLLNIWGLDPQRVVQVREREDRAAMKVLRAESRGLGFLDAIYRHPEAYYSLETMLGTVLPEDTLIAGLHAAVGELAERNQGATLYLPLAVGMHVDHQVAFLVGRSLAAAGYSVAFYEDFPYALVLPGALEERLETLGGAAILDSTVVAIDSAMRRKLRAIAAYRSQLKGLFGGRFLFRSRAKMARRVREYAARFPSADGAYGERLWRFRDGAA
jgi:LmbE family N-acetylglucosaminyl deacetylase